MAGEFDAYRQQAGLRGVATFSPADAAHDQAYEDNYSDTHRAELEAEIRRTTNPSARATLLGEYASKFGSGGAMAQTAPIQQASYTGPAASQQQPTQYANSVDDVRKAWGADWADASDQEVLNAYSGAMGVHPMQAADWLNYGSVQGGLTNQRLRAAGDTFRASLAGLGEAVTPGGMPGAVQWFHDARTNAETDAAIAQGRANDQGAVNELKDVHGVSDLGNYVVGQGANMAPMLSTMAGAAGVAALTGGTGLIPLAVGAAATWPQMTGDLLQTQRQSGDGQTNLGAAAAGGAALSAMNMASPEATFFRGPVARAAVGFANDIPGVRGALTRTALSGASNAALGAGLGAGQEVVNQGAGRMQVNPNEQMWSDEEQGRMAQSSAAGAVVGGALGTVGGGWRRTAHDGSPAPAAADAPHADLLDRGPSAAAQPAVPRLGMSDPDPFISLPDGSVARRSELGQYANLSHGFYPEDRSVPFDPNTPFPAQEGTHVPYEGAVPYSDTALPQGPQAHPAASLQVPEVGNQGSLFRADQLDTRQAEPAAPAEATVPTATPDLFAATPSAAVRTDFHTGRILQELQVANGGKIDAYTAKLAQIISDNLETDKMPVVLEKLTDQLEAAKIKPDTAAKRQVVLNAAKDISDRYTQRMNDALAHEAGQARNPTPAPAEPAAPAATTAPKPVETAEKAPEQAPIDAERKQILDKILADPDTRNPLGRFTATLKKAGHEDATVHPDEAARISRFHDVQEALADNKDVPKVAPESTAPVEQVNPYRPAKGTEPQRAETSPAKAPDAGPAATPEPPVRGSVREFPQQSPAPAGAPAKLDSRTQRALEKHNEKVSAYYTELDRLTQAQEQAGREVDRMHKALGVARDKADRTGDYTILEKAQDAFDDTTSAHEDAFKKLMALRKKGPPAEPKVASMQAERVRQEAEQTSKALDAAHKALDEKAAEKAKAEFSARVAKLQEHLKGGEDEGHPKASASDHADMRDVDDSIDRYNNAKDPAEALRNAEWVYDEAQSSKSRAVRDYAQGLYDEHVDRITKLQVEKNYKEFKAGGEEGGKGFDRASILPFKKEMPNTRAAAQWLAKNAALPEQRELAARLVDKVGGGPVKFVAEGDFASHPMVDEKFAGGASAITEHTSYPVKPDTVHLDETKPLTKTILLHELVHAATMRAVRRAENAPIVRSLENIRTTVMDSLQKMADAPGASAVERDAALFFKGHIDSAEELLAYGSTSPTLRRMLMRMDEKGNLVTDSGIRAQAEKMVPGINAQPMNLFHKMVDGVRKLLGLEPKFQKQLESLMADRSLQVDRTALKLRNAYDKRNAFGVVDRALGDLLDRNHTWDTEPPGPGPGGNDFAAAHAMTPEQTQEASRFNIPEPTQHGSMAGALMHVKSWLGDWRNRPGSLGWLSLRQITDRFKDSEVIARHTDAHFKMHAEAEQMMHPSDGVIKQWRNLPSEVQRQLGKVMIESTMNRIHADVPFNHESNAHLSTNDAFETAQNMADHARLAKMYQGLGLDAARKVYRDARADGMRQWNALHDATVDNMLRAYEPTLGKYFSKDEMREMINSPPELQQMFKDGSKEAGMPYNVRASLRSMLEDANVHAHEAAQMKGPYFPLVRNGQHVVVAKSDALKNLQTKFVQARDHLQELYNQEAPTDKVEAAAFDQSLTDARKAMNQSRENLNILKNQDKHYAVSFFEHRWEAENYQRQLMNDKAVQGAGLKVDIQQRAEYSRNNDTVSPQYVRKLEDELRRTLPKADFGSVQNAMREVYLRTLPERSALKSELRRLNVPGAKSTEMMQGFATRSMGNAWRVSRMRWNQEIMETLSALRSSDNRDDVLVGDEFSKRLANSLSPPAPNAAFRNLAHITHLSTLGLSPSYLISNALQPWVISSPIIAARHGWARTAKAMGEASAETMGLIRAAKAETKAGLEGDPLASLKSWRFNLDPDNLGKTAGERDMIKNLFNQGLMEITVEHDLSAAARGDTENWLGIASKAASTPAYVIEVVNRVATALASYRLEMQKHDSTHQGGIDYAQQVVADTHLDYSAANSPRLMRSSSLGGLGQLLFQFKRFSQGMIYLQGKLIRDSLDHNAAPEVRTEARKAFAYLNGLTFATSGIIGLPMAGGVGLMFQALQKLWTYDDEPEIAAQLYAGVKDAIGETAAQALVKGLPAGAGMDVSKKLGFGELTNPGRVELDAKINRDMFSNIALGLAGPGVSLMANWAEAVDVARTDPVRALTMVLPTVARNPLQAWDRTERGIIARNGKELIGAQEFGATESILKTLGFETTHTSDMYDKRSAFSAVSQRITDKRGVLVRNAVDAVLNGGDVSSAMRNISEFNTRNPQNHIDSSAVSSAVQARVQANATSVGGIPIYQPKSLDALRRITP